MPILTSIVPLQAVPERLRHAVSRILSDWTYAWDDVSFAGTAELGHDREIWVFATAAGPLAVGDTLESAGGRAAGIGVSAFSGGVIPVTPYQAQVYEYLGRRGSGPDAEPPPVPRPSTTADTGRAAPS